MSGSVQFDLETEDRFGFGAVGNINNGSAVHLQDMNTAEAQKIKNTEQAALRAIGETAYPHPQDKSLNGKVTLGAPEPANVISSKEEKDADMALVDAPEPVNGISSSEEKKEDVAWEAVRDFPHLAWESIKIGLAKEKHSNTTLHGYIKRAEQYQKNIDLLLDFSAELTALSDEGRPLTDKMKTILDDLKNNGVDLRIDDKITISKDKKRELTSLVGSQVDKHRTDLQILFTTKIQVTVQNNSSIMETLKDIIKNNSRLISTITGHYANR